MASSSAHLQMKSNEETVQPDRKIQTLSTNTTTVNIIIGLLTAGVLVALTLAVVAVVINQQHVSELKKNNHRLEGMLQKLQTMLTNPIENELPQPHQTVTMPPETSVSTTSETTTTSPEMRPTSCAAILSSNSSAPNGVYTIILEENMPGRKVWCDMETDGGGWTRFQRRQDGSLAFDRTWSNYRSGFGSADAEFWLGNDDLHRLTAAQPSELRVDLWKWDGEHGHAKYSNFSVDSANTNYRLHVGGYNGTIGDAMVYHHNSQQFSTKDRDNDGYSGNCATKYGGDGGWWHGSECFTANLNGRYSPGGVRASEGVFWFNWQSDSYSYKTAAMLTRPRQ